MDRTEATTGTEMRYLVVWLTEQRNRNRKSNRNLLRISAGRRVTNWQFTSVVEELVHMVKAGIPSLTSSLQPVQSLPDSTRANRMRDLYMSGRVSGICREHLIVTLLWLCNG